MTTLSSRILRAGLIAFIIATFAANLLPLVLANVPMVVSLRQDPEDPYTLIITIVHENPSPEHYVDRLQFLIDGGAVSCPGSNIALGVQQEEEFTIEHSCAVPCHLSTPYILEHRTVKVRAHCTEDGWSEWSETVEILEFHPLVLPVVIGALGGMVLLARRLLEHRRGPRDPS